MHACLQYHVANIEFIKLHKGNMKEMINAIEINPENNSTSILKSLTFPFHHCHLTVQEAVIGASNSTWGAR